MMNKPRNFNTKILSFVLSLTMLLSMTGVNTVLAAGKGTVPTQIWVNGANILQDSDRILECGGGTAVYEESSNTLTLNAAEIDTAYQNESTGIFADGDLNIVINGDCSITEDGLDSFQTTIGIGIWATGGLAISGGGSLTINVKDAGVQAGDISISNAKISVSCQYNSFWASTGTITVSGGDITAASTDYPALWANTDLTITGGKVNAASAGSNGMGAGGSLSISGISDVTAKGPYPGLFATGGIFISGGKVNAIGTNDSGIFTRGTLSISDTADVTATGGLYCGIQADGAITISGGKVNAASPNDSAIYTPVSITVTGSPEITAEGYLRALQTAALDISGGRLNATSTDDSAITAKTRLSITGDADVIANGKVCALLAENIMVLSAKNIEANSHTNYAVSNVANDITIGGKLIAESQNVYAVRSFGNIVTDNNADISATGGWGGIQADGDITFNGSKIEAIGNDDDGIYSTGTISINGGSIYAKGGAGYAAIRAKSVQTAGEAAASKIALSNLVEKNGGKVAFIDWFDSGSEVKSFTTFIGKEDTTLHTSMKNALREVWLAVPYTVTFDLNGGNGDNFTENVYPNDKVAKPADPTKNGSIFSGWYNGHTVFDFANTAITGDITLTANWHIHTYGTDWESDAANHWHECTANDGAKSDVAAHTSGEWIVDKEATETEKGSRHKECTVCKYVMETEEIPMVPHTHTYGTDWESDAANHWHECTANDGAKSDVAAHTSGEWIVDKEATETEKGSRHKECTVCKYVMETEEIPMVPHTHTYGTDWESDAANHWHECTANDGAKSDVAAHTAGDWIVDKEATETEKGSRHKECTVCKYVMETVEIPMVPHTHTYGTDWESDAANHWHECTANDGAKSDVAAHTAGDWIVDKEATETEKGSRHKKCTVCKYVMETEEIPVIPPQHTHTPSAEWTTDATNHWHECTANDGAKSDVATHTAGDWIVDKEATETEKGSRHKECTVCRYVMETVEIPEIPPQHTHTPSAEWTTDAASHWNECSCGEHMNIAAHSYGEWTETKAATETEKGSKERTCSVCGYRDIADIPAAGRPGSPQTGSSSNMFLWIVLLFASGGLFIGTVVMKRRFE